MQLKLGQQPVPDAGAMDALGRSIARQLHPGAVLALTGDLGAGKTTLVRGICAELGVPAELVASPTFALCHVYEGDTLTIAHLDLYRLESPDDLAATGLDEWLSAPDAICLIEWPQIAARELPPHTIWLDLTLVPGGRTIRQRLADSAAIR